MHTHTHTCARSALLHTLLGEMKVVSGHVRLPSAPLAFSPQTPWLRNDSILSNITLGHSCPPRDIRAALHASCLVADLAEFPKGVHTHAGERGLALSGGQRQRVSIARAVAAAPRCGCVVLDDPLSALDGGTAAAVVQRLWAAGGVLRAKTCVVATSQPGLLAQHATRVVVRRARGSGAGRRDGLGRA